MSHADRPITRLEDDRLGRRELVDGLRAVLLESAPDAALVVGIFGRAGSGKSSVLNMLGENLVQDGLTIRLDAWHHGRQQVPLWRKLLFAFLEALSDEERGLSAMADTEYRRALVRRELEELATWLFRSRAGQPNGPDVGSPRGILELALGPGGPGGADLAKRLGSKDAGEALAIVERRQHARDRDEMVALDEFHFRLRALMGQELGASRRRVWVLIDHLDRCAGKDALAALEAIRLFLDVPSCAVVLALDPAALSEAAPARDPGAGARVLDRVVDLRFRLPALGRSQIETLVREWSAGPSADRMAGIADLIVAGAPPDPRPIRRLLVGLCLLQTLHPEASLRHLAKLLILKAGGAGERRPATLNPKRVRQLEQAARRRAGGDTGTPGGSRADAALALEPWFEPLDDARLAQLLTAPTWSPDRPRESAAAARLPCPLHAGLSCRRAAV